MINYGIYGGNSFMLKIINRKKVLTCILALLLTFMHIAGWQISMDYGSSVHTSAFFQKIGVLKNWQCLLIGAFEWCILSVLFYRLFTWLEKRETQITEEKTAPAVLALMNVPRYFGFMAFGILFAIWMLFLWGCYPGYYNYDIGNQLPQFMYAEVPYNAHHPLLHTIISGAIITLGYHINSTDLTLGLFMYSVFQMAACAACLSYSLHFIYKRSRNLILTIVALIFYALCPPLVMLAMSATKDVLCYSALLVGIIGLWELVEEIGLKGTAKWHKWIFPAVFLIFSCLMRKNVIYAVVVLTFFSLMIIKKERLKQLLFYIGIFAVYFAIDKALVVGLNAIPGSLNEALCVPYQQIARLYTIEGADAFTDEEYAMLSDIIPPQSLLLYDPAMADPIKANFNPGLETLKENAGDYLLLWLKKGLEYPKIYIDSFLYNTYQAWYPGTTVMEQKGVRYFYITDWQEEYGTPNWQGLYDFYQGVTYGSYTKYPVFRLFFATGTMFWISVIAIFYSLWKKDKSTTMALLLNLLVCATSFCGPVSDVRYYLILFYLAPVCFSLMLRKNAAERNLP